jgi:hypothetical protein
LGKIHSLWNGFYYKIEKKALEPDKSYMIVANHTSMTDYADACHGEKPFVSLESRIKQDTFIWIFL